MGKVGAELTEAEGYKAARETILISLAVLRAEIGSLDRVRRIVKLVGWVNSAPGFARSSVGANELPLNIPVEIELVVEVSD